MSLCCCCARLAAVASRGHIRRKWGGVSPIGVTAPRYIKSCVRLNDLHSYASTSQRVHTSLRRIVATSNIPSLAIANHYRPVGEAKTPSILMYEGAAEWFVLLPGIRMWYESYDRAPLQHVQISTEYLYIVPAHPGCIYMPQFHDYTCNCAS